MATSWTDQGASSPSARVLAGTTPIRGVHINELITAINGERARRATWGGGFGNPWSDGAATYGFSGDMPVTANSTAIRATHIAQLRVACTIPGSAGGCPSDSNGAPSWTDPSLTANVTNIRAAHINDLRAYVNSLQSISCLCNCNYNCGNNGECSNN